MDAEDGARRLGLLIPSTNTVMERDFVSGVPPDVSVHTARMFLRETTADDEQRMVRDHLPGAIRDLATARPHVVVFGCTSASATVGRRADEELMRGLSQRAGAPAVSVNESVHEELRLIGARRIHVLTPYIPELTERICDGLLEAGFDVSRADGMGLVDPFELCWVGPKEIVAYAREKVDPRRVDAVFISCTNLRAMEAHRELADALATPVITSNAAALACALRALGLSPSPDC